MANGKNLAEVEDKVAGLTKAQSIEQLVRQAGKELSASLPKSMSPQRVVQIALTCIRTNPELATCTPESFLGSLFVSAQLGLEPIAGNAYILPFWNKRKTAKGWIKVREAQFIIGYKGIITLFYRHEKSVQIFVGTVHENDDFKYEYGTSSFLRHVPNSGERGKTIGFYSLAQLASGGQSFLYMTKKDCVAHGKKHSKTYNKDTKSFLPNSPWVTNEEPMCGKTVVLKHSKVLPLSFELQQALSVDETSRDYKKGVGRILDSPDNTNWDGIEPAKEVVSSISNPKGKMVVDAVTPATEPTAKDDQENADIQRVEALRRSLARIHILKKEKQVPDDTYLDHILKISNGMAATSKDLNDAQREELIKVLDALPMPKSPTKKASKEVDKKPPESDVDVFDDSAKFDEASIKLHIRLEYAKEGGEPSESLMVLKLFGIAEKWVSEDNPVSVRELINKHPSAKAYFRGVILPRLANDKIYSAALKAAIGIK